MVARRGLVDDLRDNHFLFGNCSTAAVLGYDDLLVQRLFEKRRSIP
jgi:hypothetical protein